MAVFSTIGAIISAIGSAVGSAAGAITGAVGAIGSATGLGTLGTLATVGSLVGTGISAYGAMQQAKGAKRAEALRQRQMNLQSSRERRQTVRQAIVARAQAINAANAQGVGASSGALGGASGVVAQGASNVQGINQGQELGTQMFAANSQTSSGQTWSSIGGTIQGISNMFAQNSPQYGRVWGIPA